jgi:hypothetical protein
MANGRPAAGVTGSRGREMAREPRRALDPHAVPPRLEANLAIV